MQPTEARRHGSSGNDQLHQHIDGHKPVSSIAGEAEQGRTHQRKGLCCNNSSLQGTNNFSVLSAWCPYPWPCELMTEAHAAMRVHPTLMLHLTAKYDYCCGQCSKTADAWT